MGPDGATGHSGGNAAGTNTVLAFDVFRFGETSADVAPYSSGPAQPPMITGQPADTTITVTYPATFSVTAMGEAPLRYQRYFNTPPPLSKDQRDPFVRHRFDERRGRLFGGGHQQVWIGHQFYRVAVD